MNPIAVRLLNQQLAAPQFSDPAEVVSYMGAMQAQEYRMMRWAVEMRTRISSSSGMLILLLLIQPFVTAMALGAQRPINIQ